ncbi:hypothetical protein D3C85_1338500 [compost metagenome]
MMSYTGLPFSPIADSAHPNSTETSKMHSTLPSANAWVNVLGMMPIRKSTMCRCWAFSANPVTAEASSVLTSTLKPPPGLKRWPPINPISSETVEMISKYSSALPPTRPTFFKSRMPAMPVTTVQKTTGPMIILISLMNASPNGLRSAAKSGQK